MAWFSRKDDDDDTQPAPALGRRPPIAEVPVGDDELVLPKVRALPQDQREWIAHTLADAAAAGIDVDDLASIAAAYDGWLADWLAQRESKRPDHQVLVDRLGVAIGEHLVRHTDMEWGLVSDAFGTDLGVAARSDDFAVVPMNLVAVRWLNRTSGWVPGVVGHLVALRTTMR